VTVAHIPFKQGMDESVDPRQAPPGTLTLLKNGVFVRGGEIRKRNGMTAFGALDTRGAGLKFRRLFARGDSLCAIATGASDDIERVFSYVEATNNWVETERSPEMAATWFTPTDSGSNIANPDVAYFAGHLVYCWRTGDTTPFTAGELYVAVVEAASGTVLFAPQLVASAALYPRIIAAADRLILAWQDNATSHLYATTFPLTAPFNANTPTDISGAALVGESPFDMVMVDSDRIAWVYTLGGDVQILHTNTAFAVAAGPLNLGAPGVTTKISCSSTAGDILHVVYADAAGPTFRCAIYAIGVGLTGDAALAASLTGVGNGTQNQAPPVCLGLSSTQTLAICGRVAAVRDASTGLAVGNAVIVDGPVVGRPFLAASGRYYCVAAVQRNEVAEDVPVASPMLVELPFPNTTGASLSCLPAGAVSPRMWGDASHAAHVATDGTSYWSIVSTSLDPLSLTILLQHQTPLLCKFTPGRARTVTILGGLAVSAGAVPWTFDGAAVADVGYTTHAPTLTATAAGGLTAGGTYLVGVTYERFDALGNLHRSAPTYATVSLSGGNQSFNADMWYLTASAKDHPASPARIALFMTDNGGSLFYRQTAPPLVQNLPLVGGFATLAVVGFLSGGTAYPLLYTTGGVLPDNPPPGFLDVCVHRDRLWGVSGDQRTIWFSKRMSDQPKVFPGFHETLTLRHESDVVALSSHEGMLLILAKRALYILDGEGPPATGFPSDYGPPRRIPSDVGCMTPHSVVSTSTGTFFQGSDGRLYRVNGASLGYVGKPVEEDIAAYPSVRAAVLCESANQVRFVCMNAAGTAGIVLVFDMLFNQWSRFEYHEKAVHGAWWRGKFVTVLGDAPFYEDSATFYDGTTNWVYLEIVTAWISFTSPTGWQRVRRVEALGEYRGPHKFYLELSCDYATTWLQSCLFDEAATLVNKDRVTVHVGSQNGMSPRNRAIRVRLRDGPRVFASGETGEGARWSGLGLDVLQQEGVTRHGAAKAKV
jgi:hypothetical protein